MKKLILVLAIALIASPAFAALSVYLANGGSNVVDVMYSGSDANSPSTTLRAVALDLTINGTGTFTSFVTSSYKTGESVNPSKGGTLGYGIYPARIVIDSAGTVTDNGNPLAAASGDPGAGTGFGSNHIVLEFASLYFGDGNVPSSSGKLCSLNITPGTATQVVMDEEDTYRGGIVFEDGSLGDDNDVLYLASPPGKATIPYPSDTAAGISRAGVNLTWVAGSGATSHNVYFGTALTPRGNQSGNSYPTGAMTQGVLYTWRIDEQNSAGVTTGDVWTFRVEECYKTNGPSYTNWTTLGRPSCWCFKRQCNGDGNGAAGLGKSVTTLDFTNFQAGYNKTVTQLKGVVDGAGLPAICADYNHSMGLSKPVTTVDFAIFQSYYNKATTSVPLCVGTYINFWMN